MEWVVAGIIVSFLAGAISDLNRRYKLDGFRLNFWRSLVIVIVLLPIAPFVYWPPIGSWLYPVAIMGGIISMVGMTIRLNLASQHNGRIAGLFTPVKVFVLYLFWLLIDEPSRQNLIDHPMQALGVMAMFGLAGYAMVNMRKNDASWKALITVLPVGFLYAVNDGFGKYVLDASGEHKAGAVVALLLIAFGLSVVMSGIIIWVRRSPERPLFPPKMGEASLWMGGLGVIKLAIFYYGMIHTPNPAYLSAIMMLTPVWFIIYHRVIGVEDKADPVMGMVMVASSIGLVMITN